MRIVIKEVGKEMQVVETSEKYRMNCVKEYIGKENIAEFVPIGPDGSLSLGVNEEGILMNLPTNFLLSMLNPFYPIQKIVGTAVFVRTKPVNWEDGEIWDLEVTDLTEADIDMIRIILSPKLQVSLQNRFKDYGKESLMIYPIGGGPD